MEAGVPGISRTTRCRVLSRVANIRSARKQPPLSKANKEKRLIWAKNYMKVDFRNVIFTDECRATLDGPDGFARGWIGKGQAAQTRLRRQQGGGGVMFWAALHDNILIGPFRVPDGVKMKSPAYIDFLQKNFIPYYNRLPEIVKRKVIFMQDNAPSHASYLTKAFLAQHGFVGRKYMNWPAQSPDINPIENYWSVFKSKLYENGRQFSNKNEMW
jgi:hypothetical protein